MISLLKTIPHNLLDGRFSSQVISYFCDYKACFDTCNYINVDSFLTNLTRIGSAMIFSSNLKKCVICSRTKVQFVIN